MFFFIVGLAFMQIAVVVSSECKGTCNTPTLVYDDLRCKPVYEKPGDCCPLKYDCSHIEKRPEGKCLLKGKYYDANTMIDDDLTYGNCHVNCRCMESTDFLCAILDCPEWLGVRPKPGCYLQYALNKCCGVKEVCEPFDKLAKCKVGDKEYMEGIRFSAPDQKCVECVCQKGFDGKFVEPFCKKANCTVEIRHSKDVEKNCAPAYSRLSDCCPSDWICPETTDKIVPAASVKRADLQCSFGSKLLNIGDKFERNDVRSEYERFETKCECTVPPFLTCTKRQIFDVAKAPEHLKPHLTNYDIKSVE